MACGALPVDDEDEGWEGSGEGEVGVRVDGVVVSGEEIRVAGEYVHIALTGVEIWVYVSSE